MSQFNFLQVMSRLIIGLLRPLTVPLEMFCHEDVGERYPGFASIVALVIVETWCLLSDDRFPYFNAIIVAFVVRLIVHRAMAIRRRVRGGTFIPSRSPGRPLLARAIPQLPEQVLHWLEPVALILTSAVICMLSASLGSFLLCSSIAWLVISLLRTLAAYNLRLDAYDADPQAAEAPMAGRYFEVILRSPALEGYEIADSVQHKPLQLNAGLAVPPQQA